jgi:hypothetical protein
VTESNLVDCRRCSFRWAVAADKRGRKDLLCINCRARKQAVIQYGKLRCEPYEGLVDQELNPIDEQGNLVKPGERICGHKDCMADAHIVLP